MRPPGCVCGRTPAQPCKACAVLLASDAFSGVDERELTRKPSYVFPLPPWYDDDMYERLNEELPK